MKSAKGDREKQLVAKVVSGEIIAKYRAVGKFVGFCSWKRLNSAKKMNCFTYRKKRSGNITDAKQYEVRKFFERDTSSRMCARRNDCITRGSVKKQKLLLVDTIGNLYDRFQSEHEKKCHMLRSVSCARFVLYYHVCKIVKHVFAGSTKTCNFCLMWRKEWITWRLGVSVCTAEYRCSYQSKRWSFRPTQLLRLLCKTFRLR